MARAALRWSTSELGERAGVHRNTIVRIEAGEASHGPTIAAVRQALEGAGVIFLEDGESREGGVGVRLAPGIIDDLGQRGDPASPSSDKPDR